MSPQAYERAKRALRTSLGRGAANAEAVYTQAFISGRRVGEAGGPKRARSSRTVCSYIKEKGEGAMCLDGASAVNCKVINFSFN